MFELVSILFSICLGKKTPQALPYSINLVFTLAIVDIAITFLALNINSDMGSAFAQAILGAVFINLLAWLSLQMVAKTARFYQTSCALLGTDALISFFAIPVMATFTLGQGGIIILLLMLGILFWQWLVVAHILKAALAQTLLFSLGLAFLYLLATYSISAVLFPQLAGVNQ